jgi:hypothetical protein
VSGTDVVRALFDAMQARDWAKARSLVADDAIVVWPVSGERFAGAGWIAMNEAYPEGWTLHVVEVVGDDDGTGDRAAARVAVEQGGETFWCAGFYVTDGRTVTGATEIWATQSSEAPPDWRRPFWHTAP